MAVINTECSPKHIFVVSNGNFLLAFSGFKNEGNTLACFITPHPSLYSTKILILIFPNYIFKKKNIKEQV